MSAFSHAATIIVTAFLLAAPSEHASANSLSELLEKALYAEEAEGDLATAIELYRRVLASAEVPRTTGARALLRLGMCYRKIGRGEDALAVFRRLSTEYPEEEALIAQVVDGGRIPPTLGPSPWGPLEVLLFRDPNGSSTILRVSEQVLANERRVRVERAVPYLSFAVDADLDTFRPLECRRDGVVLPLQRVLYSGDGVDVVRHASSGVTTTARHSAAGPLYDYVTLPQLIRRLPLDVGYRALIPVFDAEVGRFEMGIEVVRRAKVAVPAGTFEAYEVQWSGGTAEMPRFANKTAWYSTDPRRYLVKWDSLELVAVGTDLAARTATVESAELDVAFEIPAEWYQVSSTLVLPGEKTPDAVILGPGMQAVGGMRRWSSGSLDSTLTTAEAVASYDYDKDRNMSPRDMPPESFEIHGIKAARILVEVPTGMFRYRVYVVHEGYTFALWFILRSEHWQALKPTMDRIAESLRLAPHDASRRRETGLP